MDRTWLRRVSATTLAVFLTALRPDISLASEIWFGPRSNAPDYLDLFNPGATWWQAEPRTSALIVGSNQLVSRMTELDLSRLLDSVTKWNMPLAVGLLPLARPEDKSCGFRVEGFSAPGQSKRDVVYLRKHGMIIKYFGFDEPLYFGHAFHGLNACSLPLDVVAEETASTVNDVVAVYPDAIFGDVEPIGQGGDAWVRDICEWFDLFKARTGKTLGYFRADIQWNKGWIDQLRKLSPQLKKRGISLQVIFNGQGSATTDADWVKEAVTHIMEYKEAGLPNPDAVVFQFWTPHPSHALPETDLSTMTGLIKYYSQLKPFSH